MDHICLVTVPVFGCVTSEQKPPLRIRKYLFIQELCNLGKYGSHGPAFLSPLPGAVLCLLTAQDPQLSSADEWVLRVLAGASQVIPPGTTHPPAPHPNTALTPLAFEPFCLISA